MVYESPVSVIYSAVSAVHASGSGSQNSGNINNGNTGKGSGGIELPFIPG